MYLITGGGSGIGQALAKALAAREQSVLVVGRRSECIHATTEISPFIQGLVADVTSPKDQARILQYVKQQGPLKGLIHSAGTIQPIDTLNEVDISTWKHAFEVNLFSPLALTKALLPSLKGGKVLVVGTGAAYFPVEGWSAYCSSKAGLAMLTRCFQLEIQDPAFASVMPGITDTDMVAEIRSSKKMSSEKTVFFKQLYEEHRLIKPEVVGLFLAWLLLDVEKGRYTSQEWDIYDKNHHASWLMTPHQVPSLE